MIALRLALRELRGGVRGLRIVLACLAIGVAAIAAVGSLRAGIDRGLAADGAALLGGDIAIGTGAEAPPAALSTWLRGRGAAVSEVVDMRSLLVAASGARQLVSLKAVDGAYPLVGEAVLAPPGGLQAAFGGSVPGMVVDPLVLQRLKVKVGDVVRLGNGRFRVAAALVGEPDRVGTPTILGPRVMIGLGALAGTGLVQPGSLLSYAMRALVPGGGAATAAALRVAFPDRGWRVRLPGDAAPGVGRFLDQLSLFLTLVGLTALLVGGIGVATGVGAWMESRARTIAVLRCLGASSGVVLAVFLIQVFLLCAAGIVVGVVLGAAMPAVAVSVFGDQLPVPARVGVYPVPLLLAAAYGLLTAGAFALWPVARAARIPGGALFRDGVAPAGVRPRGWVLAVNVVIAAALVGLLVAASPQRGFALAFCAAAGGTLLLFRGRGGGGNGGGPAVAGAGAGFAEAGRG